MKNTKTVAVEMTEAEFLDHSAKKCEVASEKFSSYWELISTMMFTGFNIEPDKFVRHIPKMRETLVKMGDQLDIIEHSIIECKEFLETPAAEPLIKCDEHIPYQDIKALPYGDDLIAVMVRGIPVIEINSEVSVNLVDLVAEIILRTVKCTDKTYTTIDEIAAKLIESNFNIRAINQNLGGNHSPDYFNVYQARAFDFVISYDEGAYYIEINNLRRGKPHLIIGSIKAAIKDSCDKNGKTSIYMIHNELLKLGSDAKLIKDAPKGANCDCGTH